VPRLTRRELEKAVDEGLIRRLYSLRDVGDLVPRFKGREGVALLRAVISQRRAATLTRSEAEEMFLNLIRASGLPPPEVNVKLHGFTVDFFWRREGVVVEIDGFRYHSTRSAFERDHRKDGVLRAARIEVLRFTYDQVADGPLATVVAVSRALATARAA
jgi:very-short-patch-repair endonuclease